MARKRGKDGKRMVRPLPVFFLLNVFMIYGQAIIVGIYNSLRASRSAEVSRRDFIGEANSDFLVAMIVFFIIELFYLYLCAFSFRRIQKIIDSNNANFSVKRMLVILSSGALILSMKLLGGVVDFVQLVAENYPSIFAEDFFYPIAEEFVYRGLLLIVLEKAIPSVILRIAVASTVFSLFHFDFQVMNIIIHFGQGLVFSAIFISSKSVWPGAILHMYNNIVVDLAPK
jgi:membrane protease YdiL (CAAX protease family)